MGLRVSHIKYRILYAGSAKCGQTARIEIYIYTYIYIYRKFVPVVRLGWLAPARQLHHHVLTENVLDKVQSARYVHILGRAATI